MRAVSTVTQDAIACNGGRHTGFCIDPSDPLAVPLKNVKVSGWIGHNVIREADIGINGDMPVSAEAAVAVSGDGRDDSVRRDLSNAFVAGVCNIEGSRSVDRDADRKV